MFRSCIKIRRKFVTNSEYILDFAVIRYGIFKYALFYCGYYEIGLISLPSIRGLIKDQFLWRRKTNRTAAIASFNNDIILTKQNGTISLLLITKQTFSVKWTNQISAIPMKLFIHQDNVWVFGQNGTIYVFEKNQGGIIETLKISEKPVCCIAGYIKPNWIFSNAEGIVIAFNPELNNSSWVYDTSSRVPISGLSIIRDKIFVINQRGEIWEINSEGKILKYHFTGLPAGTSIFSALIKNDVIFWGGDGSIYSYDLNKERSKEKQVTKDCWIRSIITWKDHIIYGDDCGNIIWYK